MPYAAEPGTRTRPDQALRFEYRHATVELVADDGSGGVVGRILPPQAARIELCYAGRSLMLSSCESGCFWLTALPRGPVSLRCELASGVVVQTSWVVR